MANRDGRSAIGWEIQVETKQAIKEEANKRGMAYWEFLDQLARDSLGLDDASTEAAYERNIERLEGEVASMEEEIERMDKELENKREQLQFYKDGLEELREGKASYQDQLDDVLTSLEDNPKKRVPAFRTEMREAATDQYGRPTESNLEQVKEDLWERAMDTQRDVQEYQFNAATGQKQAAAMATDGRGKRRLASLEKAREGKLGKEGEDNEGDGDDENDGGEN